MRVQAFPGRPPDHIAQPGPSVVLVAQGERGGREDPGTERLTSRPVGYAAPAVVTTVIMPDLWWVGQ
jgi:hypothetical protein